MPRKTCHFDGCNKQITIIDRSMGKCKCGYMFCQTHRPANLDNKNHITGHICTYNWHEDDHSKNKNELLSNKCGECKKISTI